MSARILITDDDEVVDKFTAAALGIKHIRVVSAMLLGAPNGSDQSVEDVLSAKLVELRRLSSRITLLNAHDSLFLLKNCFSIPKMT